VRRLRYITAALAALCVLAVAAPSALALDNRWEDVIRECYNTGQLDGSKYTKHALKQARRNIPTDIREYSDCLDLIDAALAAKAREHNGNGGGGGAGGGGAGGSGTPPIPTGTNNADPRNLQSLRDTTDPRVPTGPPQVQIGNQRLSPATRGLIDTASLTDANSLPVPLIVALAALAAMAAVGAATVLRQRGPQVLRALRIRRR
jgi:hypothetical protein